MSSEEIKTIARRNVRSFTLFRAFFSARFYYPVYALLFLDYGLTLGQFGDTQWTLGGDDCFVGDSLGRASRYDWST